MAKKPQLSSFDKRNQQVKQPEVKQPEIKKPPLSVFKPTQDLNVGEAHDLLMKKYEPEPPKVEPKQEVTVQPGDTLWGIAEKTMGAGDRWKELQGYSGAPEQLPVGTKLTPTPTPPVEQPPVAEPFKGVDVAQTMKQRMIDLTNAEPLKPPELTATPTPNPLAMPTPEQLLGQSTVAPPPMTTPIETPKATITPETPIAPVPTPSMASTSKPPISTFNTQPTTDDTIDAMSKKHGVPSALMRVQINQESGGSSDISSPAGARGIAQFIPETARAYGLRVDDQVDERTDPVKSIEAQAKYMKDLYSQYGTWERALSAYNSGQPDAYLDESFANGETYNYVKNIMGRYMQETPEDIVRSMRYR